MEITVIFYLGMRTVLDLVVSLQVSFPSCQIFFKSERKRKKLLVHFRLRRNQRGKNLVELVGSASNNIFGSDLSDRGSHCIKLK